VRLSSESLAKQHSRPQVLWITAATIVSLLAVVIGLYLDAWPQDATWRWVSVISLAYLIPVTLAALRLGSPRGIFVAVAGSVTMLPLLIRGVLQGKSAGMVAGLGAMALVLPAWAYLLRMSTSQARADRNAAKIRQSAQITCLSTVSNAFRVEASLPQMLNATAQSIGESMGCTHTLISLAEDDAPIFHYEASFGFSPSVAARLRQGSFLLDDIQDVMRQEFQISQSYYVPADHQSSWTDSLQPFLLPEQGTMTPEDSRALLIVPMYGKAQKIAGAIILAQGDGEHLPDPLLVETIQIFAQQTATAVDNYRLYSDLHRRVENLILINDIGQAISSGLEHESVLRELVAVSAQVLNSDYSVLYAWDRNLRKLVPQVSHGLSVQQGTLFGPDQMIALTRAVVHQGKSVLISDVHADPNFGSSTASGLELRSVLMVPLVEGNRVSGALMTGSTRAGAFDDTDQILLATLADQASVAIQNARLYENTSRQVSRLAALNDLGKTIISSLDIDVTLDMIMNRVEEAFEVEAGSLLLIVNSKLMFAVTFGPVGDQVKSLELEIGQGIAGWVALTGISVLVPDAKSDERHYAGADKTTGFETRSLLCVPLKGPENRIIGVLEIMNPRDGRPFNEQDQELLESIATFAVIAIQNAQLYQQTMSHVTDLSSLYEVGKAITSSLDIRDTLQIVVDETVNLTGAARTQIVLIDGQAGRVSHVAQHGFGDEFVLSLTYRQALQGLNGWVLSEKTPTLSSDIREDERMRDLSAEQIAGPNAQSMIVAPLLIKGEPIGTLSAVRMRTQEPFTERELGLLNMLAGQAAVAIENAHFFEERKRQITELSILNQTGQALSSTLEPEDLMELIYSQVAQVMDAQNFFIALYDVEEGCIRFPLAYEHGVRQVGLGVKATSEEWLPRASLEGLTGYIVETKQALWIPNQFSERVTELGIKFVGAPAKSWLGVPILSGDQVLGVIAVQSYEQVDVYDGEHLDLLMTIASQASAAIRNAQLFAKVNSMTDGLEGLVAERTEALAQTNEELTIERDRLNVLYMITRETTSSLEPERGLNRTMVLINRALQAQHGFVLLQDGGGDSFVYRAAVGETPPSAGGKPFPSPRIGDRVDYQRDLGLIGWLVSRQNSIRVNELGNDPRWHVVEDQGQWHRSALAAPLLTGDDVIGAIILYHADPDHFTVDHERMINAIAAQIAVGVSNAVMFRLLREAADRLGKMLRSRQLEAAKSHAILEGVADGVMVTDAKGEITLFNAAAERILQIQRTDVIGRTASEMSGLLSLAGVSWDELSRRWGRGEAELEQVLYDERLELDERVISVRVAPVVREEVFEGTVSVFRDITKDVEVDRMKSELVSSVSHELRTPMTSIKGYIDLLYSGMAGPVSDDQKRFLQIVKTNADRLTLLVNDLLDLSRIEMGRLKLIVEPVDPMNIINIVLANHAPDAMRKQQVLSSIIEGPLPMIRADPGRMTQILTNLVSNAIHYTPTGGTITVEAQVSDDFLHMHIRDTGIGIKEEDQPKLFSRFFRADTPLVQARSGTGLGLTIVRSLVELQGGEVWFESTYGEGSTFSFSMPLADKSVPDRTPREFRTISYRAQDKHILIIESEMNVADMLSHQLRSQGGYRVHLEKSGREALNYLKNEAYRTDLVLLDLDMPDMDGLEIVQAILGHKSLSAIPIVALSLLHREQNGKRTSTRAYVSRPVRSYQLLEAINAVFAEQAEDVDGAGWRVLLVEEDKLLAELFTMVLTQKGFVITMKRERGQVIDSAKTDRPDLILLDIQRTDKDGYEILRQLKDAPETWDIPVLVLTGNALDGEHLPEQDLDVSALQFTDRPVEVDDLVVEIRQALDDVENKDQVSPN
jgi:PAS domain S-box-containing protein